MYSDLLLPILALRAFTVADYTYATCIVFILIAILVCLASKMDIDSILNIRDAPPGTPRVEDDVITKLRTQVAINRGSSVKPHIYNKLYWGDHAITRLDHYVMVAKLVPLNKGYYEDKTRINGKVLKSGKKSLILHSTDKLINDMLRP